MNVAVPLYLVLAAAGAVGLLYLLHRWVRSLACSAQRLSEEAQSLEAELRAAAKVIAELRVALAPASEELKTNMAAVPELLKLVARIGNAQLEIMQAQRAAETGRERNPFGRSNGPMPPRDVSAANLEDQTQELMRGEGITREEAQMRLNPANQHTVWEGNRFFEGWGG